jgi:ABC-2 type transport system permease protein
MPAARPATLSQVGRPPRPSALSNALVFGWRAVLKFKHVPEQLFDLVMTPIMFTLLFTFVFGGALAGRPANTSSSSCPESWCRR